MSIRWGCQWYSGLRGCVRDQAKWVDSNQANVDTVRWHVVRHSCVLVRNVRVSANWSLLDALRGQRRASDLCTDLLHGRLERIVG